MHPRTPFVLALVAFLLAAGAGAYAWQSTFRTVPVLVAARDLAAGQLLAEDDLQVRHVPAGGRPDGALESAATATGRYAALPLLKGDVLTPRHLTSTAPVRGLAAKLPSGQRVISVSVKPEHVLGGALSPGDIVDVAVAFAPADEKLAPRVETLLTGIRVVDSRNAAGLSTKEKQEYGGQGGVPAAVLLQVTPAQATRLISAVQTKDATLYLLLAGREAE